MHHQEVTKDLIINIQDILVSPNLKRYGSLQEKMLLILVRVKSALMMHQWSNRVFIVNTSLHLEDSFMLSRQLISSRENMVMKIKTKYQTKSCLRRK